MLCSVGDLVEDVVVRLARRRLRRGDDNDAVIERRRGGSAANVAAFAAAAGLPARFVGQVGADAAGRHLVDELAGAGVDVRARFGGRTGTVTVLVEPGGGRTMLTDRGASVELDAVDPAWLDGVTVLHVPAYSLVAEPLGTTTRTLVTAARARSVRVTVDASSAVALRRFGPARFRALLAELAPDVLFANAAEAMVLKVSALPAGPGAVVVKRGPDPALLQTSEGTTEVPATTGPPARDTTGAGDAFAAGFLHRWSEDAPLVDCVVAGHALARRVVGSTGATLGEVV